MSFKLCSLASGSKGNCIFISDGNTRLLVDAGVSLKEISSRLSRIGENPADIDAVLLSHIHSDHARSVEDFCLKYQTEVYRNADCGRGFIRENTFRTGERFQIGTLSVEPVPLSHDTPTCDGFVICSGETRAAVVTDLGVSSELVEFPLHNLDVLVVECNHDLDMLARSRYPYPLRSRIKSSRGHLSNECCAELIERVWSNRLRDVYLAHLSEENNTPELAYYTVCNYLRDRIDLSACHIHVCSQSQVSEIYQTEKETQCFFETTSARRAE